MLKTAYLLYQAHTTAYLLYQATTNNTEWCRMCGAACVSMNGAVKYADQGNCEQAGTDADWYGLGLAVLASLAGRGPWWMACLLASTTH